MTKIFLDTNILIDILVQRNRADKIIEILKELEPVVMYISANSVTDSCYILRKNFTVAELQKLFESFEIIDTTKLDCEFGMRLALRPDDIEDLIQINCCNRNRLDIFLTADKVLVDTYSNFFDPKVKVVVIE